MDQDSDSLHQAYELGRNALKEDLGENKLSAIYHDSLIYILNDNSLYINTSNILNRARKFYSESLSPFEIRQKGYQDVVNRINRKNREIKKINEKLENEVEERKRVESELKKNKKYFQSLIQNSQDIITLLDYDGIITFVSPLIKEVTGFEPEEIEGHHFRKFVHPEDLEKVSEIFKKIVSRPGSKESLELRFKNKESGYRILHCKGKNMQFDPTIGGIIVNSRDITEKKNAELKLRQREKQLTRAQEIANLGSWSWHLKEDKIYWSDELYRIFGVPTDLEKLKYERYIKHIHPDDRERVQQTIQEALEHKTGFKFEHRVARPDNEVRYVISRGQIITDEKGDVVKMLGTAQDITEQKETELEIKNQREKLRKLQKRNQNIREKERSRIARELHDDLGQMLTVLKMNIGLLHSSNDDKDSEFEKNVDQLKENVDKIIESLQRITSELRPEELDNVGLIGAIEWQVDELKKNTELDMQFKTNMDSDKEAISDEQSTALFRMLQETLTNVIRHANATKVEINLRYDSDMLLLLVSDNGVGITNEQIKNPNSLGIMGIKERAHMLDGKVGIHGVPDQGTTVKISLPINQTELAHDVS